jgi:DNA-directed RNA polymerase specialized sigma24 family protein
MDDAQRAQLDAIYRAESRRVLATLIRLLGDFDLAEEALHEAFRAAMEQWPQTGIPANPRAWLVSAGRFKAIDQLRRQRRFQPLDEKAELPDATALADDELLEDDRLRLIFTCCHPALASDAQVALTRQRDALNMVPRLLPMLAVEQDYRFQGPQGEVGLLELFACRSQLIVYHFMYHMDRGEGCDGMPDLDGKGLHWTRPHDKYEQPAARQDCCAHKA